MALPGYEDIDWKANAQAEGSYAPIQLFTAEDDIKTTPVTVLTGQNLAVGLIVAFNVDNKIVPWAPAAADATADPVGIIATAINTTAPIAGDRMAEIYVGGCFNPDLLIWPAALNTWLLRSAALQKKRATFRVKRLL